MRISERSGGHDQLCILPLRLFVELLVQGLRWLTLASQQQIFLSRLLYAYEVILETASD